MKVMVYIATSLDGYIARKDGSIDWMLNTANPTNDDYGYADFISTIDAIVLGRGTLQKALSFASWPYEKSVFVLSTTVKDVPNNLKTRVQVLSVTPGELLTHLSKAGYSSIYVDGGKTIQGFLKEDLIDELIITRIPVLIGSGIPLFDVLNHDLAFEHVETKAYPNGLVKSHYKRTRN